MNIYRQKLNLLLFGAPGSGKGAQSALLKKHYQFYPISTGDLLRKALREQTPLGFKIKTYMEQGHLVPDSLVIDLLKNTLINRKAHKKSQAERGFILDGFPRTKPQAEALSDLLRTLNMKLDGVLYLKVPEKILIERLVGRRVAEKSGLVYHIRFHPPKKADTCDKTGEKLVQRKDDTQAVVQERLKNYHKQTWPLIEYYRNKKILCELRGEASQEEVFSQIQKALGEGLNISGLPSASRPETQNKF